MTETLAPPLVDTLARPLARASTVALAAALASADGEALSAFVWCLRHRDAALHPSERAVALAHELGLVTSTEAPTLTPHGALVADSLGEYAFWLARGRTHHGEHEIPALAPHHMEGRSVLEVGCGAGVNLLALQATARVVGVDVEEHHLHMAEVLAHVEERPTPQRVCSRAEALPFASDTFDVVLFLGSLPYMNVDAALHEAARVLRPGGRAIVVQSDLVQFARIRFGRLSLRRPALRAWLRELRAVVGTAVEPLVGRLLIGAHAATHVSIARMLRRLRRAGLVPVTAQSGRFGLEACHVAEKHTRSAFAGDTHVGALPSNTRGAPWN